MKTLSKLPTIYGNLFNFVQEHIYNEYNGSSIVVPHVCNNANAFGAGFAAGVAKHYPIVKENYHLLGSKNVLGYVQFVEVEKDPKYGHKLIFANMIAQNGTICKNNRRPLHYGALAKTMYRVSEYLLLSFNSDSKVQIHCPKFGCGLAGGNWNFIQDLILDIWEDYRVVVYDIKR
ncbi:MAG: hypothetical protein EBS93_07630 [Chitinophagia bacterium]|nr:hypothetical protein [Chitinophagia bacterium]NCA30570.1 hypothetical protein [Chitinophagia bacterium]